MTTDEIKQALDNYPKILKRAYKIIKVFENNNVCSYYVDTLSVRPDRIIIHYTEEYTDGVPSSSYADKKTLEVPVEMLDPEWEDKEVKKAISKWKELLEEKS